MNTAVTIFATITSMTNSITSHGVSLNATWPFVTVPDFSYRAEQFLHLTYADFVSLHVLVTEEDRAAWEVYSVENQDWLKDPIPDSLAGDTPWLTGVTDDDSAPEEIGIVPYIFGLERAEEGYALPDTTVPKPYYAPSWQIAPPSPWFINWNILCLGEAYQHLQDSMIATDRPIVTDAGALLPDGPNGSILPDSFLHFPIHETLEKGSKIVAFLGATLPWKTNF
jgi:hypothetical protein